MRTELLAELCEAHGTSGREDAIREIVRRELSGYGDLRTDYLGNLHCVSEGKKGAKKLLIAAHMDEIGFAVKYIDDKGFCRLAALGGWDPRQMAAQRVFVHTQSGPLPGLLMQAVKPKHMLSPEEASRAPKFEEYIVDLGMTGEEAKSKVRVGDTVTMQRQALTLGKHFSCKALDDRVGVFVMIEAVRKAKKHSVEVHAVATVQEEIGLRGAAATGWSVAPDICVALDVTLSNDIPGVPESDHVTKLGNGTAIKVLDSSLICHPKVVDHFRKLADEKSIAYQLELLTAGGTDAGAVQRLHGGIPSFTLSIPCRYIHTVNETVHLDDVQASIDLLAAYIEDAHNGNYQYE